MFRLITDDCFLFLPGPSRMAAWCPCKLFYCGALLDSLILPVCRSGLPLGSGLTRGSWSLTERPDPSSGDLPAYPVFSHKNTLSPNHQESVTKSVACGAAGAVALPSANPGYGCDHVLQLLPCEQSGRWPLLFALWPFPEVDSISLRKSAASAGYPHGNDATYRNGPA
jgi:hypothetical protein